MSQESNNGPRTEAIFLRENMTLSKDSKSKTGSRKSTIHVVKTPYFFHDTVPWSLFYW